MGQGQLLSKGITTEGAEDAEGLTLIRMRVQLGGSGLLRRARAAGQQPKRQMQAPGDTSGVCICRFDCCPAPADGRRRNRPLQRLGVLCGLCG